MVELGELAAGKRRNHAALGALPPLPAGHRGRLHLPVAPRARTCSWPGTTECPDCDAPVFEIGSCKRCGAVHVSARRHRKAACSDCGRARPGARAPGSCSVSTMVSPTRTRTAVADDGGEVSGDEAQLCTACGALATSRCSSLHRLRVPQTCDRCASSSSAARRSRAAWCAGPGCGHGPRLRDRRGRQRRGHRDLALPEPAAAAPIHTDSQRPGEGRKLLAFSDSRQSAAYFAPYLEDSYARLQRRRLIIQGLLAAHADEEPVAIEDVVFKTRRRRPPRSSTSRARMTAQQQTRMVAPWVMAEVLATDDRQSLEGLGLVSLTLYRDPSWRAPAAAAGNWG